MKGLSRKKLSAIAAATLTALTVLAVVAPHAPATTTPQNTYSSTAGGGTKIVVSRHGNILSFISPNSATQQYEHFLNGDPHEGYVLCHSGINHYDSGFLELGFGGQQTIEGNTITRTTGDGKLRLKQVFTFAGSRKALTIAMTVTNTTNAAISDVILRRFADIDVDSGGTSGWAGTDNDGAATSRDGVTVWENPSEAPAGRDAHSVTLRAMDGIANPPVHTAHVNTFNTFDLVTECDVPASTSPLSGQDVIASIRYVIGTLNAGASKTVKVEYTRQ